jgi:4-methyl-5(b-hydroxyethyl)-thiazole monophosphate biosynthesis
LFLINYAIVKDNYNFVDMKGVNIFLADGFEDVEALATSDVLRRGGVAARLVALTDEATVESSHGVTVCPDAYLPEVDLDAAGTTADDVMIFPGGMPGSKNLAACTPLIEAMRAHYAAGGTVAAICAAPGLVLSQLGPEALRGAEFTCFEGFEELLIAQGAVHTPAPAVRAGRIVTGRSAGHAVAFGLEILRGLKGDAVAAKVRHALYLD